MWLASRTKTNFWRGRANLVPHYVHTDVTCTVEKAQNRLGSVSCSSSTQPHYSALLRHKAQFWSEALSTVRVTPQTKCPAGNSKVFSTVHVISVFLQISLTNSRLWHVTCNDTYAGGKTLPGTGSRCNTHCREIPTPESVCGFNIHYRESSRVNSRIRCLCNMQCRNVICTVAFVINNPRRVFSTLCGPWCGVLWVRTCQESG